MTDKHCFLDLWQYTPTSPPSGLYWCHWTLSLQAWCIAEWTTVTLCFQPATFNAAVGSQYIRTTCRWIVTTWSCYCSVMRPSLSARHSARQVQTAHAGPSLPIRRCAILPGRPQQAICYLLHASRAQVCRLKDCCGSPYAVISWRSFLHCNWPARIEQATDIPPLNRTCRPLQTSVEIICEHMSP